MRYFSYENSKAVALKLKHDIDVMSFVVALIVQVLFVGYYTYSAVIKVGSFYHYIYAVFMIIGLFSLGFHIFSWKNIENKLRRKIKTLIRYFKYPIRALLIILMIIDLVAHEGTPMESMAIVFSIIALVSEIIIQLTIRLTRYYIDLFLESLKMDYEDSAALKSVVNYLLYTRKEKELENKNKKDGFITKQVKKKVNEFIQTNHDKGPVYEPTPAQQRLRARITELKNDYAINKAEINIKFLEDSQIEDDGDQDE